jgi:DNA-binding transcriptional regulator YiaG
MRRPSDDPLTVALARARRRRALPSPAAGRSLRENAGLTQTDLARALNVSTAAISLWETGRRRPRDEQRERYVALLERLAREGMRSA